jgi:Amt family ammonium transporter
LRKLHFFTALAVLLVAFCWVAPARAQEEKGLDPDERITKTVNLKEWNDLTKAADEAKVKGDSAWLLISSALVMLMVPGLALFYCGMVRRKNVLATMMHSMAALAVVGVYWVAIGYALAFGDPWLGEPGKSFLGFSSGLIFMQEITTEKLLPGTNIPVYLHMLFQGMFAIITPALISGALAERIRFKPYCLFLIVWVTLVYCPLAHMVWALNWNWAAGAPSSGGTTAVGYLGGHWGALDFAGGTVVHIAAGFSSLAAILVLRRRLGYPQQAIHPNSMVLTLTGAGLLWFGWFGFNGGSAGGSGILATSAFAATQAAAAAAGLSWMLAEWLHRGKPTALGLASGIVAGLVAVTPASGFVTVSGGFIIGLVAGFVCYAAVSLKPSIKYDDSLDAFGIHGVGGFLGAVLTGVFCVTWKYVEPNIGADGLLQGNPAQVGKQFMAALISSIWAVGISFVLVKVIDAVLGFTTSEEEEIEGLDRTEHGEVGFDLGLAMESVATGSAEPRPALVPPLGGEKRFNIVIEGIGNGDLIHAWSELCQPKAEPSPEFKAVYPYVTTVQGNRFRFRGGDPNRMRDSLERLFQSNLNKPVRAHVEQN